VKTPPTRVAKTIQPGTANVPFKSLSIFPLVKEIPGLLTPLKVRDHLERVPLNSNTIRDRFAAQKPSVAIQVVPLAGGKIVSRVDGFRGQLFLQDLQNPITVFLNRRMSFLNDQVLPVAIHHEPRSKIRGGMNETMTHGPFQKPTSTSEGFTDPITIIIKVHLDLRLGHDTDARFLP
jgi:hypothetical protein